MSGTNASSTHPPFQALTEDDTFACLRLLRSRRVGPATYHRLLREHGSAAAALAALPDIARAAGVEKYQICPEGVIVAELNAARAKGARAIIFGSPDYPAQLAQIDDAPPMLWAMGKISLLDRPAISLVGARNASSLGTRMAKRLAAELGEAGYIIVSGLARGVDTAAHHAALHTGTVAIMAGGVDVLYPRENQMLFEQIAKDGLRLSEMPMGITPQARHFPSRNRIIAGLAQAVIVVEAAAKSGSLITARNALDQGRDVLAVPGHPFDARSAGCNMLIRDGATLVRSADDIIASLAPIAPKVVATTVPVSPQSPVDLRKTAGLHDQILARLGPSPVAEDQLIRDLNVTSAVASPALVELELDGRIVRQSGGLLSRIDA